MSKAVEEVIKLLCVFNETSKIIKTNTNTIYKLIRERKLKDLNLGRLKVPIFEIERFLHENLGEKLPEYIC